jgi:hypothetical protein
LGNEREREAGKAGARERERERASEREREFVQTCHQIFTKTKPATGAHFSTFCTFLILIFCVYFYFIFYFIDV